MPCIDLCTRWSYLDLSQSQPPMFPCFLFSTMNSTRALGPKPCAELCTSKGSEDWAAHCKGFIHHTVFPGCRKTAENSRALAYIRQKHQRSWKSQHTSTQSQRQEQTTLGLDWFHKIIWVTEGKKKKQRWLWSLGRPNNNRLHFLKIMQCLANWDHWGKKRKRIAQTLLNKVTYQQTFKPL